MSDKQYSTQELLEMAYRYGVYAVQNGKQSEPLCCVGHMMKYFIQYGSSEELFRQIVEWYQAGYNGLTRVPSPPVQWQ